MIEHLTQKQVEEYCRQLLRPADLLSASDHLGECEACRRHVDYAMNGDAAFLGLRPEVFGESSTPAASGHLTAEQTILYVDQNLHGEERQTVADHLTGCGYCALAVEDLRAFSQQVAPFLEHPYEPALARPAATASATESWWRRLAAALPVPFQRSPGLAFGAVLAILLLGVTGWLIWRTSHESGPEQEAITSPPQPPPPAAPAPSPPEPEPAAAPLVAQLNDGNTRLTLDQEGKLSGADDLPPAYQSMLKAALTNRRIDPSSQLKGLTRPPSPLMGEGSEKNQFSLIEPGGNVLLADRPTFRWSAMAGATGYLVEVYDSQFNLVVSSPQLTGLAWAPPQSLGRGQVYGWQVKAIKDGQEFTSPRPPAPQARFRVLDRAKANELARAKRAYASSHLTLGLLYAEAGLLKEAEQELRALQKANPDSEIARSLVKQVQAVRRRGE